MQKTLILLKPDCVAKNVCGQVITKFEEAGFTINACKMMSEPVIAMVLSGDDIIERMREMLGVTNCLDAAEGTIRAELGSKDPNNAVMHNICHASDGEEAAEAEVKRFFNEGELLR